MLVGITPLRNERFILILNFLLATEKMFVNKINVGV